MKIETIHLCLCEQNVCFILISIVPFLSWIESSHGTAGQYDPQYTPDHCEKYQRWADLTQGDILEKRVIKLTHNLIHLKGQGPNRFRLQRKSPML